MEKKVLVVAPTTEARIKAKIDLQGKWGKGVAIHPAAFEHAVGVCKEMAPYIVVLCLGAGSSIVYDQIKKSMPHQSIVRIGYDVLPATL